MIEGRGAGSQWLAEGKAYSRHGVFARNEAIYFLRDCFTAVTYLFT
jgi:hypothetical protein